MLHPNITSSYLCKKTHYTVLLLILATLLSGCAALIAAGAGAGAYSYYAGNLVRTYKVNYHKAVRTSSQVMRNLKFTIIGKTGDGLETVLKGKRADGTPVTIRVERIKSNLTQIGVRNGLIGISNRKASEQVHNRLSRYLNKPVVAETSSKPASQKQIQKGNTKKNIVPQTPPITAQLDSSVPKQQPAANDKYVLETTTAPQTISQSTLYIYYRNNEKTIPVNAHNTLDRVVTYLRENPNASIDIRGYTDSKGDPVVNLKISKNRAIAVGDYLINKGIAAGRVKARGFGATNFLASNRTENLRSMNRRVELKIK